MKAFFCIVVFVSGTFGHGALTKPQPRKSVSDGNFNPLALIRPDGFHPKPGKNLVVGTQDFGVKEDDFACRGGVRGANKATLTAGQEFMFEFQLFAPHPGDFALYISYDSDSVPDIDKKWHLIYKVPEQLCCKCNNPDCWCGDSWMPTQVRSTDRCSYYPGPENNKNCVSGCQQTQKRAVKIPSWLPPAATAVLRWENYAIHLRDDAPGHPSGGNQIEFYANCADVKIASSATTKVTDLKSVNIKRAAHLPQSNTAFPSNYNRMTNPTAPLMDKFPALAYVPPVTTPTTAPPAAKPTTAPGNPTPVPASTQPPSISPCPVGQVWAAVSERCEPVTNANGATSSNTPTMLIATLLCAACGSLLRSGSRPFRTSP